MNEGWEHDLARRAASLLLAQYGSAPRCYFEPNARKLRFPAGAGDGLDITVEVPDTPPENMDAAASEAVDQYNRMLPHAVDRTPPDQRVRFVDPE